MCDLVVGTTYNLTGKLFCQGCGTVAISPVGKGKFTGHDSGFDAFSLANSIVCPWCGTENKACEMPCSDPIPLNVESFELVDRHYN